MAPVDTKQKYGKPYLSKRYRMKINKATLGYLKCTLFQLVLHQAILSDAITTVYIICYQHNEIFSRKIALILSQKKKTKF